MKALLIVVLIAFVAQASAQGPTRTLWCHECVDCPRVLPTTPRRQCYSKVEGVTRVTEPATIGLTPPTPQTNQVQDISNEVDPSQIVDTYISPFQVNPVYQCFTVRARVGDRSITSRGCALIHQTDDSTCLQENQGEQPDFCSLCDEDDCNVTGGVAKMFTSITLIIATLFISLRFY